MKSLAYLYLNFVCNSDCVFCASDLTNRKTEKTSLTLEEAQCWINEQSMLHDRFLVSGGEPTVHPHIVDILRYAKTKFHHTSLSTNGILLADFEFAQDVVRTGVDVIAIPFYHPDKSVFNSLVSNANAYDSVLAALGNLRRLREEMEFEIHFKLLVMKPNYRVNPDIVTLIEEVYPQPDAMSLATLRISAKVLENFDELVVDLNETRPYNSETVSRMMKYKFGFDHFPLCALNDDLVAYLLDADRLSLIRKVYTIRRPDAVLEQIALPYYESPFCSQCAVEMYCPRLSAKNSSHMDYDSQLRPISLPLGH